MTIDSIDDVQLLDGQLVDGIASVTVRFVSQQSRHIYDGDGNEIMDDAAEKETVIDVWTFGEIHKSLIRTGSLSKHHLKAEMMISGTVRHIR